MALTKLDLLRNAKAALKKAAPQPAAEPEEAAARCFTLEEEPADGICAGASAQEEIALVEAFMERVRKLDGQMEELTQQLLEMGIPEGVARHSLVRDVRTQAQARLLRSLNGEALPAVRVQLSELYNRYIQSDLREDYAPAEAYGKPATALLPHECSFDGVTYRVYGDPERDRKELLGKQGKTRYPMSGTCGLCSTGNVLTLAGAEQAGEEDVIGMAFHGSQQLIRNMELFHPKIAERGGTTNKDRRDLLLSRGIDSFYLPVNPNRGKTMEELADLVRKGYGVILTVDVAKLWKKQRGAHAITLTAVTEDGQTFFYCDTGIGEVKAIDAAQLAYALYGCPCNVTTEIIR